ncbi:HAMP domain-containing protein [Cellulomonas sp. APG4]|nr:ATP-binding protein [Cellulomonas sp. APG4]NCT90786.1 HAMP domain-containing protein [Cellulomonas sp. APG4]
MVVVLAGAMGTVSTLALRGSLVDRLDDTLRAASERVLGAEDRPRAGSAPSDETDLPPWEADGPLGEPPPGLDVRGQAVGTVTVSIRDGEVVAGRIDAEGQVQALSDAAVATLRALDPAAGPTTVELGELGTYRALATTTSSGDLVVTGVSAQDVEGTVTSYLVVELLVTIAGVAAAVVVGGALVRRELRPLERVASTAAHVAAAPLARGEVAPVARVPTVDTDPRTEVGQVGSALNRLLDHVEAALGARHASETQVRQFVADASHELRTPLASIRGYAELVRRMRSEVPDDVLVAMGRVEAESERMTRLVEDMLLLARLDAGRDLERAPVDLSLLAADAVTDAHVAGPDHRWHLDVPAPDDDVPPTVVRGDEHRLRQVLVNLLANARVHTPPGTTVVASVRRDDGDVVLTVRDDGPGIAPELVPHLFRRFTRGDEARSPRSGSTGLGLAIVDAVVGAHGGTIAVTSAHGVTQFVVRLPVTPVQGHERAPSADGHA